MASIWEWITKTGVCGPDFDPDSNSAAWAAVTMLKAELSKGPIEIRVEDPSAYGTDCFPTIARMRLSDFPADNKLSDWVERARRLMRAAKFVRSREHDWPVCLMLTLKEEPTRPSV